jgi:hypothetical protein
MFADTSATLIRTHNNNQGIVKAVQRAIDNGIWKVIVVVNAQDPMIKGNVRSWLKEIMRKHPTRVEILEMAHGYTWTSGLNRGFAHIDMLNQRAVDQKQIDFVLSASVEVLWSHQHLEHMGEAMLCDNELGLVGTTFQGMSHGNPVNLGRTYNLFPRNTLAYYRLKAFHEVGYFSPICDFVGGMEDFEWQARLVAGGKWKSELVDFRVPVQIGINHPQNGKEERELDALRGILRHERSVESTMADLVSRLGIFC